MAEIVEYRVEKTLDELNLLVDFELLTEEQAKQIVTKRQNFEYALRRRTRTKLDFLKYIRFEVNLLESIDKYRKTILANSYKKEDDELDELDRKILLLQAKKLNDVVRSRSAHISSLFRKLTTSFQFDRKLWLAYIDFAKSRSWNSRVSSLYWRLLRVSSDDEDIWIAAANHELEVNKAYDNARGLFLRALRHHPASQKIWNAYFHMELQFMDVVDQRARIVFKIAGKKEANDGEAGDIWVDVKEDLEAEDEENTDEVDQDQDDKPLGVEDKAPTVIPIDENDKIIAGHLPKTIYRKAIDALVSPKDFFKFLVAIVDDISRLNVDTKGTSAVQDFVCQDLRERVEGNDSRVPVELADHCENFSSLKKFLDSYKLNDEDNQASKKLKKTSPSKMDILYECYESNGIEATRNKFIELEKSVKNQKLSLYVGMIQVELWQLAKDSSNLQLDRIRTIYEKALTKFGKVKPKLWYEYLQFQQEHAKTLEDFARINQTYVRAQSTLHPAKVDKVIEKYTLLQNNSSADIEYSDYSDIEE